LASDAVTYVVLRDVEGGARLEDAIFADLHEAWMCFEQAGRVCDNDPDEMGNGDQTIVSQCWLYAVNTTDTTIARETARTGQSVLLASYCQVDFPAAGKQ
jgi:hypothetical protein